MSLTDDPTDPRIIRGGPDKEPREQHEVYLVLSEAERAKGFVRPLRNTYRHVGPPGPEHQLRDLDEREAALYGPGTGPDPYVKFEAYPPGEGSAIGRYWTQAQLDAVGRACGSLTTMGTALAETYARQPHFYGSTYCCECLKHLAVEEFVWAGTSERVGS